MRYLIAYVIPVVIILVSIPMVLGKVPPNKLYGFRTPKTLSSEAIWYPANRMSGWFMTGAGIIAALFNSGLLLFSDWPERTLLNWLTASTLVPLVLALFGSVLYLRRL